MKKVPLSFFAFYLFFCQISFVQTENGNQLKKGSPGKANTPLKVPKQVQANSDKEGSIPQNSDTHQIFEITEKNFLPEDLETQKEALCNEQLVEAYRMFPFEETAEPHVNFICPYIKQDCCAFSSQKLIQILWARISNPRIQRILTRNLHHIEKTFNFMKDILNLYKNNFLPQSEKYSAECLTSMDEMSDFLKNKLNEKLDQLFENIKEKFNLIYKFKKQFYCTLCDQEKHRYFNIFDKQIYFSTKFCSAFQIHFKDIAWFLNYELIKYFETFRNYILCYKERNFLLADKNYKFIFDREMLSDIALCRDEQNCEGFCNRYSFTKISETFIGNVEQLEQMHDFLRRNQADNRGFFIKEDLSLDQKEIEAKNKPTAQRLDFFGDQSQDKAKGDIDNVLWDFYKNSFDMHRKRIVKQKMDKIKGQVEKEFDERALHQNFLTINQAKIDLDEFNFKISMSGYNPYDFLDKEDLYKVNANLTLYEKEISNVVQEMLNLNETDIMKKMVNVSKLISEDNQNLENVEKFLESKLFDSNNESKFFLVENPWVDSTGKITNIQAIANSGSWLMRFSTVVMILIQFFQ